MPGVNSMLTFRQILWRKLQSPEVLLVILVWRLIIPVNTPHVPFFAHAWVITGLYCLTQMLKAAWQDIASRRN